MLGNYQGHHEYEEKELVYMEVVGRERPMSIQRSLYLATLRKDCRSLSDKQKQ